MASRKKRPLWIDEVKQQATSGTPYANKREEREAQNTPTQRAVHAVARGTGSQTTNTGRGVSDGVEVLQKAQRAMAFGARDPGSKGGGRIGNLLGAAGNSWLAGQANMLGTLLGSGIDSTSGAGLSSKVREKEIKEYREKTFGGLRDKTFAAADKRSEKAAKQEQAAKKGLGSVGKLLVDAGIAGTQMAMDATVGGLTGTGMLSMGTRTFGDSARQAREAGASWDEANRYGLGKAGVEVGTEKLFDAMKLFGGGKMDKAMEAALNKMAKTDVGRTALRMLGNIGGEGAEETISDLVDPILRQTYDKNAVRDTYGTAEGRKELASETLYDALVGGILGGIGGTGSIVTGENARKNDALRTPEEREAAERPQRIAAADAARARQDALFGTDAETLADMQARQNRTESPVTGAEPQGGNLLADAQTALTQSETGQNGGQAQSAERTAEGVAERLNSGKKKVEGYTVYRMRDTQRDGATITVKRPDGTNIKQRIDGGRYYTNEQLNYIAAQMIVDDMGGTPETDAESLNGGQNAPTSRAAPYVAEEPQRAEKAAAQAEAEQSIPTAAELKARMEEMLGRPLTEADLDSMTDQELADRIRPAVEQDTVMGTGAAARGFTRSDAYDAAERYMQAIDEYGAMPERENLAKQIPVPRSMDGESVVSRVAQSAINAENTDNRTAKEINREVADGGFSYAVITDADASQRAQETIKDKGWDGALSDWTAEVKSGKVSKDTVTTGLTLYNAAVAAGEPRAAARILVDLTNNIRSGAQATQAASLLDKLTPQGQLYGIQRSVENLNESIRNRLGDKATDVVINEDLAAAYLESQTDEERADAMDAIYQNVADQIPATWQDKLNAWRYLSMLFNPLTHIRNIVGNSGFAPVRGVKNVIGAGLEAAFIGKNEGRTKSLVMPAFLKTAQDKARYQAANDEWGDVVDLIQSGGKFKSDYNEIRDRQTIFGLKVLEAARKFNNTALDTEDTWFSKQAYSASLTQYLKANGITAEQYNAPGFDKSAARAYAIKEAQKATYRDFNAFSDYIAGLGKTGNKVGDTLVEAVLPFKRTPANILARGVEYSPIGLLRGVKNAMFDVKSGKVSAAEAIDHIASGLTGTGLTALGVLLAHLGLLTGGDDKDEREAKENSLTGHKPYALEVGGHSIPLDWLAPEALPVFVGVELYNGLIRDGGYNGGDSWLDPIKRISEPMLEMSMLSGINDILDSISYSDNKTWAVLSSAATSYLSQYVPTLFGKIEQTTEGNRKSTYINKDSAIPSDVQRALGKAFNKLPGEFQQVDYIDAWGRKQTNGTVGERILRNFINPSNYTSINETPVDTALRELVRKTGDSSLYPSAAERKITVNGEDRNLTAAQYTRYATEYGQMRYQLLDEARKSAAFRRMTSAEQAETVHKLYEYANAVSQHNIFRDKDYDAWVGYAQNAKREFGISSADYIMLQQRYGTNYLSGKDAHEKAVQAYKNGVELETYLQIRNSYSDYDADGNGSMKQSELKSALDAADLTDEQRAVLYGLYNKTWKNNPYL